MRPKWVNTSKVLRTVLCCCSVAQSCLTLCNPMDCSTPGFPILHYLPGLAQTHVHWASDAIQPSHPLPPLLLLPSIFPSIRIFPSGSALRIRWPKVWSYSFNISPSNEYRGLISFRMEWLDLSLLVQVFKKNCQLFPLCLWVLHAGWRRSNRYILVHSCWESLSISFVSFTWRGDAWRGGRALPDPVGLPCPELRLQLCASHRITAVADAGEKSQSRESLRPYHKGCSTLVGY